MKLSEDRIVCVTTDSASNMKRAIETELDLAWMACLAHGLNLSVRKGLGVVRDLLKRCKKIAKFFRRSNKARRVLQEKQQALGLKERSMQLDNKTRWNSAYKMLSRLSKSRPAISASLGVVHDTRFTVPEDLSAADWKLVKEMATILKPLKQASEFIGQQTHPVVGCAMPIVYQILNVHLTQREADAQSVKEFKQAIRSDLENRWESFRRQMPDVSLLAVLLDPRFKDFAFVDDRAERSRLLDEAQKALLTWLHNPSAGRSQHSPSLLGGSQQTPVYSDEAEKECEKISSLFGERYTRNLQPRSSSRQTDYETEVASYLHVPAISAMKIRENKSQMSNPLEWWSDNESRFPAVARIARSVLCTMATSVPSERIFSKCGWIVNKRRVNLSEKTVSLLAFIACNV